MLLSKQRYSLSLQFKLAALFCETHKISQQNLGTVLFDNSVLQLAPDRGDFFA